MTIVELETPHGTARAHLYGFDEAAAAALVLGHGAGGGPDAPDLVAARKAALSEGLAAVLVEQPYRVAGRRAPPRAPQLDAAWISVVEQLAARELSGRRLIVGGRSAGARVACRTAQATGAVAVLSLAFPLEPPSRDGKPRQSRLSELDAVRVPTLAVQGERDPFGVPPPGRLREVVTVSGDHALKADLDAVGAAVKSWLRKVR